jgi:hypothetical protein
MFAKKIILRHVLDSPATGCSGASTAGLGFGESVPSTLESFSKHFSGRRCCDTAHARQFITTFVRPTTSWASIRCGISQSVLV